MSHNSNTDSHSNNLSSRSSSRSSFVTIIYGDPNAPDINAGIVGLVSSLAGREVNFSEQSEEANEIRRVILHQMSDLLYLLESEGTSPDNNGDSETADKRIQSVPLGRVTAKGWIKNLGRAWTRNAAVSSHLMKFEELYPDWDSTDNYKLARILELAFQNLHTVLQDLERLFHEFPDTSDEEDIEVGDVDPLNPFLSDDEFVFSDDEPDTCVEHCEDNCQDTDESESTDEEMPDLEISRLHIDDSSNLEEVV